MKQVFNFCAGPAMLPAEVMAKAQQEFVDWQGHGMSIMEFSHRDKHFVAVAEQAEADLRELMAIPSNYKVLFCHGGGRGQFAAVPMNLIGRTGVADYLVTGQWSKAAVAEAQKYGEVNQVALPVQQDGLTSVASADQWQLSEDAAYFHYCPNETVDGIEMFDEPAVEAPLVADLSSTILSRTIDVNRYGLIYAGAQKNIGPSGLSVVIVREDLLGHALPQTPSIFDYQCLAKHGSMFNTPPTYAWYLAAEVFKWLKAQGGVAAMEALNQQKSQLLYDFIDNNDFYRNQVAIAHRSRMNIPFQLADASLDASFLADAEARGLMALKGHRSVGGMRASIYNAMPLAGVEALVAFMDEFAKRNG